MILSIFEFIDNIIKSPEPTKSFIVCVIYALFIFLLVLVVGFIIDKLEAYQIKVLNKIVGYKAAIFVSNKLTFPGVMIHELSHALFATLFGAKVTKMKLFTLRDDDRLGWIEYMTIGNKWKQGLQHVFSACAPTVVGVILELLLYHMLLNGFIKGYGWIALAIYMMISIGDHMSMSKQDIRNYIRWAWAPFILCYGVLLLIRFC